MALPRSWCKLKHKKERSLLFQRDRDDANVFCKGSPWSFLIFDQLPYFLCDMRYPDSAGCTKNEEEPDKGYTDSHVIVDSAQEYGVRIIGPVADDPSWQARTGEGSDKSQFVVDWDRQTVTCPAGKQSLSWLPNTYPKNGCTWEARFARKDCTPCALRTRCTKAKAEPRIIGLQPREYHEVLQQARQQQQTDTFRLQYAARAGIESTHEQALRRCGLRHCRYMGV